VAPAPAPAPALPPGLTAPAPSAAQLHPVPPAGPQQVFTPTAEQMSNAKAIVQAGRPWAFRRGRGSSPWPRRAGVQPEEPGRPGCGNDHDSLGLFQQRPRRVGVLRPRSRTRSTRDRVLQRTDPGAGLGQHAADQAAQKVQVSAYPDHYAKHEAQADERSSRPLRAPAPTPGSPRRVVTPPSPRCMKARSHSAPGLRHARWPASEGNEPGRRCVAGALDRRGGKKDRRGRTRSRALPGRPRRHSPVVGGRPAAKGRFHGAGRTDGGQRGPGDRDDRPGSIRRVDRGPVRPG
jgi:hypothetical protein